MMGAAESASTRLTASSLGAQKRCEYCVNGVGRALNIIATRQELRTKIEARGIGQGEACS